jgi:hypothetical protein
VSLKINTKHTLLLYSRSGAEVLEPDYQGLRHSTRWFCMEDFHPVVVEILVTGLMRGISSAFRSYLMTFKFAAHRAASLSHSSLLSRITGITMSGGSLCTRRTGLTSGLSTGRAGINGS